jgi:DNA-binding MarR family transcriptional regulator
MARKVSSALALEIMTAMPALKRALFKGFSPSFPLNKTQAHVLLYLHKAGPSSMTDLHHHFGLGKGSISGLVNGLAEKGFITRERNSGDKRWVFVRVSKSGADLAESIDREIAEYIGAKLNALSKEERTHLTDAIAVIRRISNSIRTECGSKETHNEQTQ